MKAVFLSEVDQPLEIRDIPMPEPRDGEVRIQVKASGVCGTDVHYWRGILPLSLPAVLGHEPVGVIDKLGPGVTRLKPGDRVGVSWVQEGCGRCPLCQKEQIQYCPDQYNWMNVGGGHTEFMIARADGCTLLPEGLNWEGAAPLFCAGYTIMSGYRNGKPKPGETIAVIGIGGLGHLAIQVAKAMGHRTIAITSQENKREEARGLGADEVIVVGDHAGRQLKEIGGADVILSTSNSMKQNSQAIEGLLPEGRFVTMAIADERIDVDPLQMLDNQWSLIGSQQCGRNDLVEILDLTARGKVKPRVEVYRLDEINDVMTRLAEGKVRHRAVLDLAD
ncbi:MAG: alcohol dehydrogenase catalytic domain-containing protein [Candidatus Omnitrophica bacterium]|nr:alcohol dehydrogenase catalytic domain-containing protein [Candidatus Omnitrophota bacterium]